MTALAGLLLSVTPASPSRTLAAIPATVDDLRPFLQFMLILLALENCTEWKLN
jgi:hypothetical protein